MRPVKHKEAHQFEREADVVKFGSTVSRSKLNNNMSQDLFVRNFIFTDPLQLHQGPLGVRGPPIKNHCFTGPKTID